MMHSKPNRQYDQNTRDTDSRAFGEGHGRGRILLVAIGALALALTPQGVFGQRGGGGGGHFGGGGGHFGGGGHYGGGSSGGGAPHASVAPPRTHSGGSGSSSNARPTPGVAVVHENPPVTASGASPVSSARPAGPAASFAAPGSTPAPQEHATIGFPPENAGHGFVAGSSTVDGRGAVSAVPAGRQGGALSFSGQGHEIWQNQPTGRERAGNAARWQQIETQRPRPVGPHRFPLPGGFFGPGYGYGYGFEGFYPWGFGWGFGWEPGLGFGLDCDTLWDSGCAGYGYYGPYEPGTYLYSASGDDSTAGSSDSTGDSSGAYSEQNAPAEDSTTPTNAGAVLYLTDGTSFAVTDYWVADYKLHYVVDGARENTIDLDQIDVQRTVDENAARGVNFTLRPGPDSEQR